MASVVEHYSLMKVSKGKAQATKMGELLTRNGVRIRYLFAGGTNIDAFTVFPALVELIVPDTTTVDRIVADDSTGDKVLEAHAFGPVRVMGVLVLIPNQGRKIISIDCWDSKSLDIE